MVIFVKTNITWPTYSNSIYDSVRCCGGIYHNFYNWRIDIISVIILIWYDHVVGASLGDKGWKRSPPHRGGELCPGDLDWWGPWQCGQTCAKAGHTGQYQGDNENLSPHINSPLGSSWEHKATLKISYLPYPLVVHWYIL